MTLALTDPALNWRVEGWLRPVLDSAEFVIVGVDAGATIRYCSAAVLRHFGYQPEELLDRSVGQLIDRGQLATRARELSESVGRVIESDVEILTAGHALGQSVERGWSFVRKNARRFPGTLTIWPDAETDGFVLVIRDATNRLRVEQALRESEERFKGAFQHSAIGMALVSPDGYWLRVNAALTRMLG